MYINQFSETVNRRFLTQEAGWGPSSRGTEYRRIGARRNRAIQPGGWRCPSPWGTWGRACSQPGRGRPGSLGFRISSQRPSAASLSVGSGGRRLDGAPQWKSVSAAKDSGLLKRKSGVFLWDPANSAERQQALLSAVGSGRRRGERGEPVTAGQRSRQTRGKRREEVGGEKRRREKWVCFWDCEIWGPSLVRGSRMECKAGCWGSGRTWTAKANLCLRGRTQLEGGKRRRRRKHAFIFLCLFLVLFVCCFLYRAQQKVNQPILWSGEHPTFNGYKRACIYSFFFFEINSAAPLLSPPPLFISFPTLNSDIPFSQQP